MTERNQARVAAAAIVAATIMLPLLGAAAGGRDLGRLLRFPPVLAIPTQYPRFSSVALALVLAPFAALAVAWVRAGRQHPSPRVFPEDEPPLRTVRRSLPPWGWAALGWTVAWWVLAWNRFSWFAPLQRYTFFPLWFGFVVCVNAATASRTGACMLTRAPAVWIGLFATSAAFWWVFEWLNRFSRNWHYLGVADFGAVRYAMNATLCFSTVLPAVSAVAEWLATWPRFQGALARGPRLPWLDQRATAFFLILAGGGGLLGTGFAPQRFYAALWAAPLALVVADSILAGRHGAPADAAAGDWRRAGTWAIAALVCGFFWELWNVHSAAKWIYTVPYVDRWHLFEMPLLGYTGYLPFGLECYFIATRVLGADVPFSKASST